MNIVVLLAGDSKPYEEQGFLYPKYLTEIHGKPLVEHVIEHLVDQKQVQYIFILKKEDVERYHFDDVLRLLVPGCDIIIVEGPSKGAACSALLAIEHINDNEPLLIVNGDQVV